MKKLILLTTLIAIGLSSCLKDNTRYLDFADAGNIVNMPKSGLSSTYFGFDAVTSDTAVIKFGVDYATANPNPALTVTLGIDTTLVAKYNAANPGIVYYVMPASAYVFTQTSVNIPAGAQFAYSTITIYKNTLDPAKSYMLPLAIKSAGGIAISANMSVHYFHVIGNDFAGTYRHNFERFNGTDSTAALNGLSFNGGTSVFTPVSPSEFTVFTGYDGGAALRYDVTFVKNSDGTYSNFQLSFVAIDVATIAMPANGGITISQQPVFLPLKAATLPGPYTFAQALTIFKFQFIKMTASAGYIIDTYIK